MSLLACWHPGLVAAVKFSTRGPRKERSTGVGTVPLETMMIEKGGGMGKRGQDTSSRGGARKSPRLCGGGSRTLGGSAARPSLSRELVEWLLTDVTCHMAERSA